MFFLQIFDSKAAFLVIFLFFTYLTIIGSILAFQILDLYIGLYYTFYLLFFNNLHILCFWDNLEKSIL